ncbi:hypothetical protein [Rickettsiella massiliensis]|nr:hypothetical protein [Rickettsiella massiliensis]
MRAEILNKIYKSVDSVIANLAGCEIVNDEIPEIMKIIKKIQPNNV